MIRVTFSETGGRCCGFLMKGHAGMAESGKDIVCAAVSSAAYMAVNTLTEVCRIPVKTEEKDGYLRCRIPEAYLTESQVTLKGLQLHLTELGSQYPQNIQVENTEV